MPALGLVLWVALACASSGRSFPTDKIPRIEPGRTTAQEVRDWFGEPVTVRSRGSGGSTWQYDFREVDTADTRTVSRVGGVLSQVLGGSRVGSPVNVAYSNETRHRLVIWIDRNDLVDDYEYEKTERPSKRVY
jgi:outer membrane protein assembly factor BamE (lipoprotein component of BamABCDE complex)